METVLVENYAIIHYLLLVSWLDLITFALGITHLNTSMLVLGLAALVIPAALDLARFLNMIELPNAERNEGSRNLLVDRIVSVVISLNWF
ncbi:hypothetical protein BJV78DRAFT_499627 [Lactifluus subvellereus]|nr:hypothetical protein BJV78DRAFT_499627 [Lactifluus subvellereus]